MNLPGVDGFEACNLIREFSDAYILMVTTRDEEVEKVVGFRCGADDYVTKPYSPSVLSARIGAMRRRPRTTLRPPSGVRTFGALVIDLDARVTRLEGHEVPLTKIEFELLSQLSATPEHAISRAELLQAVWHTSVGDGHVVDVHIANLRRKLGLGSDAEGWISTVRGVGYRFEPSGG